MDRNADIGTANTMRERAGENRIKIWLLLAANRLHVTAGLAIAVFVAFIALVTYLPPPLQSQLQSGDLIDTLFSTMIGAIITGTTLVVTIGQLVLSQENGPLGDQRERMQNAMDVREYLGELIDAPSPADPSTLLSALLDASEQRADALQQSLASNADEELRGEVDAFVESLSGNAQVVRDQLEEAQFGTFEVLFAALNFNYGWKIFQIERIDHEYRSQLDDEDREVLADLKRALSMFGPTREHVKTLYFEWALVSLSQLILYSAIPSLVVAGVMLAVVDGSTFPGTTIGVANITWVIGAAFTVTLVPFLLFAAYVLRIVTIAKRTLAIEPLILRDSQR